MENKIYSINGPIIKVKDTNDFAMMEMVYVGYKQIIGEVISIDANITTIQVYESTTSLKVGEPVVGSRNLLCANLGPGILKNIFDGIERPLKGLFECDGAFLSIGRSLFSLDEEKLWPVKIKVKVNDKIEKGQIYATCQETDLIEHRCLSLVSGTVKSVKPDGNYNVNEVLVEVETESGIQKLTMVQKWPIRTPRPIAQRLPITRPLVTGQRIIDTLFPIAKGGAAAVPGGFGTGKTMTQHQLAKWCDADIIVYVGCGERGNEMTQVLQEFSELIDPKSNKSLLERTVLIANTSNMPVAAREASIYTGVTIAEYYRDMGYHVALMADSTSRWAEALREISSRLEEMPAEEGFPAYLPSRISQFYERSGYVKTLNGQEGSVTLIGAVSPQGADFSEPVTQNTKRFVRTFWALDKSLAYARHYPAINWMDSYSEYINDLSRWYDQNVDRRFNELRKEMMAILQQENSLNEIVRLIGSDVLPDDQKLVLEIAKVIRVGYLQQNCFHKDDTYVPFEKQFKMMKVIDYLKNKCHEYIEDRYPIASIIKTGVFDFVIKMKYDVANDQIEKLDGYYQIIDEYLKNVE